MEVITKPTRTANERSAEWKPQTWTAEKVSAFTYRARNRQTGSEMLVHTAYGRIFEVTSDSGETYGMCLLACTCPDAANGALRQGRHCRHAAAAERVEDLIEFERRSEETAARFRAHNPAKFEARVNRLAGELDCATEMARHIVAAERRAA